MYTRLSVLALLFTLGCEDTAPVAPPVEKVAKVEQAAPPVKTATGAELFASHCASCHGPEGRGDGPAGKGLKPPPADLVGPRGEQFRGIPRRQIIEEGRPGTAMIGWKKILSTEELEALYGFIHEMKHGPGGGPHGGMGRGKGMGRGR